MTAKACEFNQIGLPLIMDDKRIYEIVKKNKKK